MSTPIERKGRGRIRELVLPRSDRLLVINYDGLLPRNPVECAPATRRDQFVPPALSQNEIERCYHYRRLNASVMDSQHVVVTAATIDLATDEALLEASYAGDEQAFEQLFLRYYARIFGVALRITGNTEDAEEVALDAFTQLHRRKLDPERRNNIGGWLYRTATNAAFNTVRSRNRRQRWWRRLVNRDGHTATGEDPAGLAMRGETAAEVRQALTALPERQRNAVLLRASGLSYVEIAEAIGVKPASVGTLLARGEQRLRRIIESESGTM